MNSFDTLIFPDTDVFKEEYYPLLLFCSPLHFLQPVEPDPKGQVDVEMAHFYQHGLWQPYTPVPLGNDRNHYLYLLDDIKKRKNYYLDQFSALTIDPGEASRSTAHPGQTHDLLVSILTRHGVAIQEIEANLELWRSRLILSIAEILTEEEDDLQEEISYFNEEEIAVLRSLKKEDSGEGYLLNEVEKFQKQQKKPRLSNIIKRFMAWRYLMRQKPLPAVRLWLASSRPAAEQVLERYKSASGRFAVPILKLALPATISASGRYVVDRIEKFHKSTVLIHRGLAADFARITTTVPYVTDSPESLLPYATDWADQWENMLYDSFPAAQDGRAAITFYLLPDHPIANLLAPPATNQEPASWEEKKAPHGLLGVFSHV